MNTKKIIRKLTELTATATTHHKDVSDLFKDLATIQAALVELVVAEDDETVEDAKTCLVDQLGWFKNHVSDLHSSLKTVSNAADDVLHAIVKSEV